MQLQEFDAVQFGCVARQHIEQADLLRLIDTPDQTGGHAQLSQLLVNLLENLVPICGQREVIA